MSPILFGFTLVAIIVVPAFLFFFRDAQRTRAQVHTAQALRPRAQTAAAAHARS